MKRDKSFSFEVELYFSKTEADKIKSIVEERDEDPYMLRMENNAYQKLEEWGLKDKFDKFCSERGILWNHNNEQIR